MFLPSISTRYDFSAKAVYKDSASAVSNYVFYKVFCQKYVVFIFSYVVFIFSYVVICFAHVLFRLKQPVFGSSLFMTLRKHLGENISSF